MSDLFKDSPCWSFTISTDFNIQIGTLIGTLVITDSLHNLLVILKLEKSGKT